MTIIKIHIFNVKLPFYPPCEVKCGLQNRVSTITGKLFEEIFLLESIEGGSIVYLDHYNDSPRSSHHIETPHRHTVKKEDSKISIEKLLPPH